MIKFAELDESLKQKIISACSEVGKPEALYADLVRRIERGADFGSLAYFYELEEELVAEIASANGIEPKAS